MNILSAWVLTAAFGVLLTPYTIPLTQQEATPFFADADGRGGGDLLVIQGHRLDIYPEAVPTGGWSLEFPPNVSAMDVADMDGNGQPELVAIAGDRILRISLDPTESHSPETLFELHTIYAGALNQPFPCTLVTPSQGRPLLALPTEEALELRTPTGTVVERFPIGPKSANRVSMGQPFTVTPVTPPRLGSENALELRVSETQAFVPQLPSGLVPVAPLSVSHQAADIDMARRAADQAPETWPWFALNTGEGRSDERVLFAFTDGGERESLVRIRRAIPPEKGGGKELRLSDPQRYPGYVVPPGESPPDFNQDGRVDVIFWDAPNPTPTVGNLSKAMTGGVWTMRLFIHLYNEEKGRFAAQPTTKITVELPVAWFFEALDGSAPMKHMVLADYNGDGRTDIAFAIAPNRYALWVTTPTGLQETPHQVLDLPGPIERVELQGDLDRQGRTSLVLRGDGALYVLSARKPQ